jgi:hypothetical protein
MPITLAEAAATTVNQVRKGIIETIIRDEPIMARIPFETVLGNAYQWHKEATPLAGAAFFSPNETRTESTPTWTQATAALTILAGDADVDNFLRKTRSNYANLKADTIMLKTKSVRFKFLDTFFYGSVAIDPKSFDGLVIQVPTAMYTWTGDGGGVNPAALSMKKLDTALDKIMGVRPDVIVTTKAVRNMIKAYIRAQGNVNTTMDEWGNQFVEYAGIPILTSDSMVNTEVNAASVYSAKTGGASSSLFAIHFGSDGLLGLQGPDGLEVRELGELETKDAERTRIQWYVSLANINPQAVAWVVGIDSTTAAVA